MFLVIFLPLWIESPQGELPENATEYAMLTSLEMIYQKNGEVVESSNTFYIALLAFAASALALGSLFSFKNRMRQIKLNLINTLVMAVVLIIVTYLLFDAEKTFMPATQGQYRIGFYLTPLSMLCNSVANRFIRKDEKMVRSADRLR
jgi:hypothetical protein